MRTGTAHFTDYNAACQYYKGYGDTPEQVTIKIKTGAIFLGPPPYNPEKQRLSIDKDGRYWLEDK